MGSRSKARGRPDGPGPPALPAGDPRAYTVFDAFYGLAGLLFAAGAVPWGWAASRGDLAARERFLGRLGRGAPLPDARGKRLLVHGVSVGEVKLARPFLAEAMRANPALEPVVSATTAAGLAEAARLFPNDPRAVFPLDAAGSPGRFLGRLRPSGVVLLELELWPAFLRAAAVARIPVSVVNGRISARSEARYRLVLEYAARRLAGIAFLGMQSQEYAARALALGADPASVAVTGNLKFDGLPDPGAPRDASLARWLGLGPDAPVLVGGSTHEPEERILAEGVAHLRAAGLDSLRLVLVPRHIERADAIERTVAPILGVPVRLSRLRAGASVPPTSGAPVLVDTVGDLEAVYRLATVAFVGGSLGNDRGGQNLLEPAALGIPVLHGPSVPNFAEAAAILAAVGASAVVADGATLERALGTWLREPARATAAGLAGQAALAPHRGAAVRTVAEMARRGLV